MAKDPDSGNTGSPRPNTVASGLFCFKDDASRMFPFFRLTALFQHLPRNLCSGGTLAILCAMLLAACAVTPEPAQRQTAPVTSHTPQTPPRPGQQLPPVPREFRAVWVSTVANIDWPSRRDLSSEQQKAEIISILNHAAQMNLNAIVLQVRPAADAIYPSAIEPWSEFLTGEQGKPPSPYYDPLQFWVEQAHERGLELHAWFNPYRARTPQAKTAAAKNHISRTWPEAVKQYGDLQWMDPAEPAAMQQTLDVIRDVVKRYDIDGVHIDDYFYPYPIKAANGTELDFPDDAAWLRYLQSGGNLNRADWRRENVNRLVSAIDQQVHQEKSWIKFGISPFGIGRPDRLPAGISGFSQYDKLYADVELWLSQGWLDYLAPQLYWPIQQSAQAFKVLHSYWIAQNTQQRYVWPGLYTSRIDHSDKSWPVEEILNQVDAVREQSGSGHLHFSMISLQQNRKDIRQRLAAEKYTTPAVIPAMPWLDGGTLPATPQLELSSDQQSVTIKPGGDAAAVRLMAIWKRTDQQWLFSVQSASKTGISLTSSPQTGAIREIAVIAIGRNGMESQATRLSLP